MEYDLGSQPWPATSAKPAAADPSLDPEEAPKLAEGSQRREADDERPREMSPDEDFGFEIVYPSLPDAGDAATTADADAEPRDEVTAEDVPPDDLDPRGASTADATDRLVPAIVADDESPRAADRHETDVSQTPAAIPRIRDEDDSALLSDDELPRYPADRPASGSAGYWGIGIGTLSMLLAVQSVLLFRHSVVQWMPASQPFYTSLCARLGCEMPLPTEASLIAIAGSDLHLDERRPGLFMLRTEIENRAGFDQALPHLELTLTDARDRAIARRVVTPEEWMPTAAADEAFPAGRHIEATIPFMADGIQPIGYRVYAFYP